MVTKFPAPGTRHSGRGIAAYAKSLCEALCAAGFHVTVVADRSTTHTRETAEDLVVERVWSEDRRAVRNIDAALRGLSPDIVHLQHELFLFGPRQQAFTPPRLLRRVRGIAPVVTTVHGLIPRADASDPTLRPYTRYLPPSLTAFAYRALMTSVLSASDAIIVHTPDLADELQRLGSVSPFVIPHGIDNSTPLDRTAALETLGLPNRRWAMFFGYQSPYKGIDTLLRAATILRRYDIDVLVAGGESGDTRRTHSYRAPTTALNVTFIGHVPEERLSALFGLAEVLVLPYLVGLSASGPLALAIGYGTPTVVSDVPTLANTLAFPEATFARGNADALAETVRRVVNDETLRRRLTERLAIIREADSWVNVAHRTGAVYQEVVAKVHKSGP